MQDTPSHELPSFTRYINRVFHFRRRLADLRDGRQEPDISPRSVFLAAFHGFLFRLRSFKELEADLKERPLRDWIGAERSFGDDVLRYSLSSFHLGPLEQLLVSINRRLKRNKAFDPGRVQGRLVAALDGSEVLASYSRCCQDCRQRHIPTRTRRAVRRQSASNIIIGWSAARWFIAPSSPSWRWSGSVPARAKTPPHCAC